jgi:hypothetical protein
LKEAKIAWKFWPEKVDARHSEQLPHSLPRIFLWELLRVTLPVPPIVQLLVVAAVSFLATQGCAAAVISSP